MRIGWLGLGLLGVLVLIAVTVGMLAYPGHPSAGRSVQFLGYTPLGRSGELNILDYLTIDGGNLYVAGISSGSVSKVPLAGEQPARRRDVIKLLGRKVAHGVAFDPVSHMGFVTRSGVNVVEVFDPATMTSVKTIPVGDDPDAILAVPEEHLIYVAHGEAKVATLIDPATNVVVGTVALGGKGEFAQYDPATKLMYQNLEDTNEMVGIDLAQRTVVGRWPLAGCKGPSGLALDAAGRRLIVACGGEAKAAVFDLAAHKVTATYAIGDHTDTIGYDAGLHRVYAAGAFGRLSVLGAQADGSFTQLDGVKTHFGAHTLAIDQATHRVYVGYAGLIVGPRVAVFQAVP